VSKGGLSAELPRVIGLTVPQAKTALGAVGISVSSVQYVYDQKIKSGTVMSLAVNGTRQPQRGDSVSLTASKGLPPVAMPSLIGLSPSKASLACRAKGITLTFRPSGSTQGIVYSQSPSAGAAIVPGSSASAVVDQPPRASISARMTKFDTTWEKYNNQLGAHITCSSGSSDDRGITSLRWQVSGLDVSITGTGNDISFILPGYRRYGSTMVTLTVVDSSGQVSTARKIIKVNWDTGTLQ
jgi:beta-lactam-binding protein with PASTA domain